MKTMRMIIYHGRENIDDELDDWGFDGPIITGITALHVTYSFHYKLWFETVEAAQKAHGLTGWRFWEDRALEPLFNEDLLVTKDGYFGDFELQP